METKTMNPKSNLLFALSARLARRALRFAALNLSRVLILSAFHLIRLTIELFEVMLALVAKTAPLVGLSVVRASEAEEDPFAEPKFSDKEVERMAFRLPAGVDTIQQIADHYGVSMRQARKVKNVVLNPPLVINGNRPQVAA